jgi:hypothetical protein
MSGALAGILTPLTSMVTTIFGKKIDAGIETYKVDGAFDTEVIKAHADILKNQWYIVLQAMFAIPLAFYYGKVHIWDAALHLGSTDAIKGDIATWDMWVMGFLFFHSLILRR